MEIPIVPTQWIKYAYVTDQVWLWTRFLTQVLCHVTRMRDRGTRNEKGKALSVKRWMFSIPFGVSTKYRDCVGGTSSGLFSQYFVSYSGKDKQQLWAYHQKFVKKGKEKSNYYWNKVFPGRGRFLCYNMCQSAVITHISLFRKGTCVWLSHGTCICILTEN